MAKTFNNIFEKMISFDALHAAYLKARKGRRSSEQCMLFEQDLEGNLIQLQNELIWNEYRTGPYIRFDVYEPRKRNIAVPELFRDRVLQNALCDVLSPIFENRFVYDSYACRIGKGTHAGVDRAQQMMRSCVGKHGQLYAFKADISKFFASIDHKILKSLIRRKISDIKILAVVDEVIDSYHEIGRPGVGSPLGNRTSPFLGNIYLDALDRYVKNEKKEKWYVRYADDWVIFHHDKQHLKALKLELQIWLGNELKLSMNHKTMIFPVSQHNGRGLDFLGFHLWPDRRRLQKACLNRFARRIRRLQRMYAVNEIKGSEIRQQLSSWSAHAKHADALPALASILNKSPFRRYHG